MFPGDDVGARNSLQEWLRLRTSLDYDGVGRTLVRWRRYGGLLYFHLLLGRLAEAGYVNAARNPDAEPHVGGGRQVRRKVPKGNSRPIRGSAGRRRS